MPTWVTPLLREPARRFRLVNAVSRAVIATAVTGAFDSATRRRGLLGRDSMPPGEALIIAPTNAIHTFFMRFDIDVAFVDRDGRVLKVTSRMRPWRLSAAMRAFGVVETPAGVFASASTARGDVLELEPEPD
jgi:uncharacterized membrane protein (UPF0127 family)